MEITTQEIVKAWRDPEAYFEFFDPMTPEEQAEYAEWLEDEFCRDYSRETHNNKYAAYVGCWLKMCRDLDRETRADLFVATVAYSVGGVEHEFEDEYVQNLFDIFTVIDDMAEIIYNYRKEELRSATGRNGDNV